MSSVSGAGRVGSTVGYLFFLTVGWTGVYVVDARLRPYVLVGVVLSSYVLFRALLRGTVSKRAFDKADLLLVLFFLYALLLGIALPNTKTASYLLAYATVFLFSYFVPKLYISNSRMFSLAMRANAHGVIIICLFAIVEVVARDRYDIDLASFIPKITAPNATTTFGSIRIHRAYSLMPEPTILGLYLNTLGLLALYWIRIHYSRVMFVLFVGLFCTTYLLASSGAALVSLIVAIWLYVCLDAFLRPRSGALRLTVVVSIVLALVLVALALPFEGALPLKAAVLQKIADPSSYSTQRFELWLEGIGTFLESSGFGYGLGYISAQYGGSFINWYLSLLVETGVIGFSLILMFFSLAVLRAWHLRESTRVWFFLALVSGMVHFLAIATFFNPFLFLIIALLSSVDVDRSRTVMRVDSM